MIRLSIYALLWSSALAAGEFDSRILPLLKKNCLPCHDAATRSSGFAATDLASVVKGGARYGQAVKPGNLDESPLYQFITGKLQPAMPMGGKLSSGDVAAIGAWIQHNAAEILAVTPKETKYWAYRKPDDPTPPPVKNAAWPRNDLDWFVLAKLEARGLRPSPEAEKRVLVRRLYFDLIGLPPTPEEVAAFVRDASPEAYGKLVDKLLSDPRYGERWARHWLDLARYADTNGYEEDTELTHAWRYRDYVVDAFNADKSYALFVKEQIAGDELKPVPGANYPAPPEPEKAVAVTFLRLAPFNRTPVSDENRDSVLSEMTSTVSSVFLGLTVGCAKCHDHKYDSIPQKDFYRMKAFFATAQIQAVGRVGGTEPADWYKPGEKERMTAAREGKQKEVEELKRVFTPFEKGLLDRLGAHRKKEVKSTDLRKAIDDLLDNAQGFDKADDIFTLEERERYKRFRDRLTWKEKQMVRLEPRAWSLRSADGPPLGPAAPVTFVQIGGDFDRPGEIVEPGFLSAITGSVKPAILEQDPYKMFPMRGRRATLANWIASPDNPLAARVMVNRLWHWHFGRGIVETTSDFGRNGSAPSHPELLDWLARRFVESQWSVKAMNRLILLSAAYRQSSQTADEAALVADPDNRLLWRFNGRRVEGEAIRDSILKVAGRLNPERGGPPVFPPMPKGLDAIRLKGVDTWEGSSDAETRKRSLYVYQRRSLNYAFLETMDAPVPTATCDRRRQSTTALQALSLYNGDLVNEEAKHFAARIRVESGPDPREQIERAFLLASGRAPNPKEKERLLQFVKSAASLQEGLTGLCRILFNSNEFVFMD